MFEHLKLLPHKALREEHLLDLGKINVICGRNSSGKSTLMEAINTVEKRRLGKAMTGAVTSRIFERSRRRLPWSSTRSNNNTDRERCLVNFAAAHQSVIEQAAAVLNVWYSDLPSVFIERANNVWGQVEMFRNSIIFMGDAPIHSTPFPDGEFLDSYKEEFVDTVTTVLVPPKRQIELTCSLSLSEPINNDGLGLLRYLFFAKNQAVSTQEYETFSSIADAFTRISGGHRFDIFPTQTNTINLQFAFQEEPWRDAQDCGLGLQDLLVLLYFAVAPKYQVVLIEEPESHLHPEWQRKLLAFFREREYKQYFLTTHSNIFLDAGMVDKVYFTSLRDSITVDDATGRAAILADLGYSVTDNLVSDLILLVEGPSDLQVIEEALIKMGLYQDFNIKI